MTTPTTTHRQLVSREEYESRMIEASAEVYDVLRAIPPGGQGLRVTRNAEGRIFCRSLRIQDALREIDEVEPGEVH